MKKIGILTFHNAENYGAVLQAYALKTFLQKNFSNYQVEIIDYKSPLITLSYKFYKPLSYFKNDFLRKLISYLLQFFYFPKKIPIKLSFNKFAKYWLIPQNHNLNNYEIIIYGSDQVWNLNLTDNDLIYLGEKYNGKKISYAASDGGELELTDEIIALLKDYDKISCRENSLSVRLKEKLEKENIETVCDPVFLLAKKDWEKFAEKPKFKNYVLIYKVMENLILDKEATTFAKKYNKKVIQIVYVKSIKKIFCFNQKFISAISPNEFVGYFAYADFVFTTSFHGTAFSIILEKDFYTLAFNKRSERITDLLTELGLSSRFIECTPMYDNVVEYKIDYTLIESKKNNYIAKSKKFLRGALNE